MKKLLATYTVESPDGLYFKYDLYRTYTLLIPTGYQMHIRHNETGKMLEFSFPLDTHEEAAEVLYSKICLKGYVRVQEKLQVQRISELRSLPGGEHYFSWDTHIYEEDSYFHPSDETYRFRVCGWSLNHQAISKQFLSYLFGEELEPYYPKENWESLCWVITTSDAYLCKYDLKLRKEIGPHLNYPRPHDLFLLMASCNGFRHYYDKYEVVTPK